MPSATNTTTNQASTSNSDNLQPPIPRDARLVALILASMGIQDCEPAVLIQLLEFAHKYTHDVLSDALVYADHASSRQGGTQISLEDVQLAVQSRVNYSFTTPPPKEMLLSLADSLNRVPLPPISEGVSLRLPPPKHCLTNVNFSIIPDELPERRVREKPSEQNQNREQSQFQGEVGGRIGAEDDDYDDEMTDGTGTGTAGGNGMGSGMGVGGISGNGIGNGVGEQRGTKRSLEEDEDYD